MVEHAFNARTEEAEAGGWRALQSTWAIQWDHVWKENVEKVGGREEAGKKRKKEVKIMGEI